MTMAKRSRRYRAALERIEADTLYPAAAAIELLKEIGGASYDPTVDTVVRLGVDTRQADQMVRGAVSLPHGIGKTVMVAVVTGGEKAAQAREAGADLVGGDELIEELGAGKHLDVLGAVIATPDMMGKLGRFGKVLGPRNLMPNPKSGTVTMDVAKAVREIKAGRVEFRADRNGNVHAVIGKLSFSADQLLDNYAALLDELVRLRPSSAKGRYLRSASVSSSASPGVPIDPMIPVRVAADA
jgi:large subunit ribosomal protein L1